MLHNQDISQKYIISTMAQTAWSRAARPPPLLLLNGTTQSNKCRLSACSLLSSTSFDWHTHISCPLKTQKSTNDAIKKMEWTPMEINPEVDKSVLQFQAKLHCNQRLQPVPSSPVVSCLCRFRCWTWWVADIRRAPRNGDSSVTLPIHL